MMCFLDIESTGLDTRKDVIMEIFCLATDDQLKEVARYEALLYDPQFKKRWANADPNVWEMHASNGLARAVVEGPMFTAREDLCDSLMNWWETWAQGDVVMAGNTIHFDRAILKTNLPEFEKLFHYRNFDVSTLNTGSRLWWPTIMSVEEQQIEGHRAKGDCLHSWELAKAYRRRIGDLCRHWNPGGLDVVSLEGQGHSTDLLVGSESR